MTLTHIPAHHATYSDRFENPESGLGYSVLQDTSAEDPRMNIADEHAALWAFREPRLGSSVAGEKPKGNVAIDAFARYYERYDAETSRTLTERYLRVYHQDKKLNLEVQTIRGYSQSDWLEIVAAVEDGYGTPADHIDEFRMWAYGDVWLVIPDGKAGISNIYADDAEAALAYYRTEFENDQPSPPEEPTAEAIAPAVQAAIDGSLKLLRQYDDDELRDTPLENVEWFAEQLRELVAAVDPEKNAVIARDALDTLVDAARKWSTELDQYVIPSAYESSQEDGDGYTAQRDQIDAAIAAVDDPGTEPTEEDAP